MSVRGFVLAALLLLTVAENSNGARILGLFAFPAKSHMISFATLLEELVKRGHQLTVITMYHLVPPHPNYTSIEMENTFPEMDKMDKFGMQTQSPVNMLTMFWDIAVLSCDRACQQPAIQKLIHSKDLEFDLIIYEGFFSECFLGFVNKFKAPLIHISSNTAMQMIGDPVGNPNPYSFIPEVFLSFSDHMTFTQRLINTLFSTFILLSRSLYYIPRQEAVMRKHFTEDDIPSIPYIESNAAFMLLNSHVAFNSPRPLTPNTAEVGGMHIKPPKKLPNDLKKFLDDAPHGVVYFSLGSHIKSSELPAEKRDAILKAFSGLKEKVLWKWETDVLPGKPDNVRVEKWLPQNDVLAHPNVKLFVTHGGLLSTQEAVYHGKPLLAIPIMGDQMVNAGRAQKAGFGLVLDFKSLNTAEISSALDQILNQPSFRENVKIRSAVFHDQMEKPLDRAVFWTEYVMRHKGAPHMHSAGVDLPWYQYHLLDVIGVLASLLVASLAVTFLVCRKVFRWIFGGKKINKSKKNN